MIGRCVYQVLTISSTGPPIEAYDYPASIMKLKAGLTKLCATNKNMSFIVTDTTGGPKNGYDYYLKILLKTPTTVLEYQIVYDKTDYWFEKDKTQVGLVLAYDTVHNLGGYSIKGENIKPLIALFEENIMSPLLEMINVKFNPTDLSQTATLEKQ